MKSRLIECRVMHHRFAPKRHRLDYAIFMIAIDLDELAAVARASRLLRINGRGFFAFNERDYLAFEEGDTLKGRVGSLLASRGVEACVESVEIVTMPRVAGYLFNPVSFYFCRDRAGTPVAAIAEVTNTFGEVKPYVLGADCMEGGVFRLRVPKHFYVSPFSDVDVEFEFVLRPAGKRLAVRIDDYVGDERTLTSTLTGSARPLRDRTLLWFVVKYPLVTLKVIAAIHWNALLLYLKRVPWFAKSARAADQRGLFSPHRSISRENPGFTRS